jgi:hypothetical protein
VQWGPHAPAVHAFCGLQFDSSMQPHVPPSRHVLPFVPHIAHVAPAAPHAVVWLPVTHVPPLQHPELHWPMPVPVQLVMHWWEAEQEYPGRGQSMGVLQPHTSVPEDPRHIEPLGLWVQSTHGAFEPHAVGVFPIVHEPPALEQQKLVAQPPPSQSAVHMPPEQVEAAPVHVAQVAPVLPHVPDVFPGVHVPASSQQPPWHGELAVQLVVHVPVAGLHASPTGQSLGPEQALCASLLPPSTPLASCPASAPGASTVVSLPESPAVASPQLEPAHVPSSDRPHATRSRQAPSATARRAAQVKSRGPAGERICLFYHDRCGSFRRRKESSRASNPAAEVPRKTS